MNYIVATAILVVLYVYPGVDYLKLLFHISPGPISMQKQ